MNFSLFTFSPGFQCPESLIRYISPAHTGRHFGPRTRHFRGRVRRNPDIVNDFDQFWTPACETVSQLRISKFFAVKVGGEPQLFVEIGCIPTVFIVI